MPKIPSFISPMLATLVEGPFDDEDWLFEIKWDGFRALAFIDRGSVQLKSRTNHSLNSTFPSVVEELEKIPGQVILDGELVVLDEKGRSRFQLMQDYQRGETGALCYYVFDILFKDRQDLREQPLAMRKKILKQLLEALSLPQIRFSSHIVANGKGLFKQALKQELEGVIGKKADSPYQSRRSSDWVKIKTFMRQEVVIGGFTAPRGQRKYLGALLVGVYRNRQLHYAGHVGGGFDRALLEEVYNRLQPLVQAHCPFATEPQANAPVTWVKPLLMCEVKFAEWTQEHLMRQPIFQGLRKDKNPKTVKEEQPQALLTHQDKVFWPEEGYTKGDLLAYYEQIAPYLLPYLKDRPIVLHRYPDGIMGKEFYQKDLPKKVPDWIETCQIQHGEKRNRYLLIKDLDSLLYAVNLGSIDLHPLLSRCGHLENPDLCILDIDPRDISFEYAVEAALVLHRLLDHMGVSHYCKTSGGKGLHILIPLFGDYSYEDSRRFAEIICTLAHQELPETTSLERMPNKRRNKVYLDCLQNRFGQTLAAPYCVRPRPHALVSTPLLWTEVKKTLSPSQFTIETVPLRLKKKKDPMAPLLTGNTNLKTALGKIRKLLEGTIGKGTSKDLRTKRT